MYFMVLFSQIKYVCTNIYKFEWPGLFHKIMASLLYKSNDLLFLEWLLDLVLVLEL